ncbi:MAG: penicillin-binding protein 2 [Thermodesulfobacteriota bacterium]
MMELNVQRLEEFQKRYRYLKIFVGIVFFILFLHLWYFQVFKGSEFRRLSENNCIRIREQIADRGILMDRKGRILAQNRPSFEVFLIPEDLKRNPDALGKVAGILGLSLGEIEEKLKNPKRISPFKPVKIKSDIDWHQVALLESNLINLPGVQVDVIPRRFYPYGSLASHLIGYLGEIDENELKERKDLRYRSRSFVGKYGVEYQWENDLRGVDGGRQIEVDALGREIRHLGSVEPFPGYNVILTLDLDLQQVAEEAFEGKNGALVAMDPRNGRILAMVSKPSFDPSIFARVISPEEWKYLVEHPFHPLQNKAIQGQYPPGSVFKIVTAIAGLETGVITPQTQFHCNGTFPYGDRIFRCWKEKGHGTISLHRAIVESCDTFFYQVGLKVGVDGIAHYAEELGLGKKTGIPLPHEKTGIVPSTTWKKRRLGVPWYPGETPSFAVGQGYLNTTPLQLAKLISIIANGGKIYLPQVVERVENLYGETIREYPPVEIGRVHISYETLKVIRNALRGVVHEPYGTGAGCALKGIEIAGKTGTAQVVRLPEDFKRGQMDRLPLKYRDHAWFVAFAPFEDPRIAVSVLVEHGGFGAVAAVPIARKVIEAFFNLPYSSPEKTSTHSEEPVYD